MLSTDAPHTAHVRRCFSKRRTSDRFLRSSLSREAHCSGSRCAFTHVHVRVVTFSWTLS